ncbi:LOW QUALITY PROTEIN: golgin subfamily B member 1-like [Colossoma macropomum]|uniref:LOW QUALITY PROTEIN: golgin subfamily B member 1-like n=1 Tax=Colossoma macropomum TaxID=42526 RepID=UPI0018642512|nr:LOW QUALITY PROTEIN: golgin subfamily B member 1-like [Colossoma macropomum]
MLKWFSTDEAGSAQGAPGSPQAGAGAGGPPLSEVTERLAQMEQLVSQLKEMIREKDVALHSKDEQLKAEKESCEARLSKMRLQNKAKVTSLNAQLEELRKQQGEPASKGTPPQFKRSGSGEAGESEQAGASRGKILLLKKKVEELEQQLAHREKELQQKTQELEAQRERGVEMDAMLVERDKRLAEKEAYIVHLQVAMSGEHPAKAENVPQDNKQERPVDGSLQELQMLVQSLTKKVGDGEERYSLLKEQNDSLKELLVSEKAQFEEKENMYKQNIQTFKDIILQKDNKLMEINQMHEQELFKLAAKSDASADLEQLLKALKQKLHEKEEVLLGKAQVIDVLQGEVDSRDQQIKDLTERLRLLHSEKENLQSKMEAERHIMRTQVRDLMEKHQEELKRVAEKHESEMSEKEQVLLAQLEAVRGSSAQPAAPESSPEDRPADHSLTQRVAELEAQAKLKTDEASKSEAKFLKMKAWSKSRIRQLEDELKKAQSGSLTPDVASLRSRVTELEEEREEMLCKLEQYDELKAKNDVLEAKLVVYEEQQRKLQADLEQVTKRAASQASESGSVDDAQSQVLEWQDMVTMVTEAEAVRDQAREEKNALVLRMSHIEEEREELIEDDWFFPGCSDPALANRQQELEEEEELVQARGLRPQKGKKPGDSAPRSLQEDFEFDRRSSFPDPRSPSGSTTPMEGENMGGWWPEYSASAPDTGGLRSVVEELELERNQLQEQILGLEERCQDLEDRLQLQARIESLQNESERLQAQLTSLRTQQSRDAEKHQLLVTSLNEQLKGLSSTQECLESSLMEKEHTLAKTSEKLELIDGLKDALREKEEQHKEVSDRLLQTEHSLAEVSKKCSTFEKQCSEMKATVAELTQKLGLLKEKTQKQEATIESLQSDLDQTNDELDKLNTTHLEERAQLIHDLQSCEREIDNLKDLITEKDKEISALSGNMAEYADEIHELKQEIKQKEEELVRTESALTKAEQEARIIKESQSSDQQSLNVKIAELMEQLRVAESDLNEARQEKESKVDEINDLTRQVEEDKSTINDLRLEMQKLSTSQRNHLSECEAQISSLKEQVLVATQKLQESEDVLLQLKETKSSDEKLKEQMLDREQTYEKEMKSLKEERNKLLAEVTKYSSELQSLSSQLQAQVECQEQVKLGVQGKLETISSLEQRLKKVEEEKQALNAELKTRDDTKEKLEKELSEKTERVSELEDRLQSLKSESSSLQKALEESSQELKIQKQLLLEVQEKLDIVQNENSSLQSQVKSLTEENQSFKQEIEIKVQSLSQISQERDTLLSKISSLEIQHVEYEKSIEELTKEKEELNVRTSELNNILEQNKQSLSEDLLGKTSECNNLRKLLEESEGTVTRLQNQIEALNTQVDELNCRIAEKEKTVGEQSAQIDAQQNQVLQLQETLTLLQEQGAALKSGLLEKDTLLQDKVSLFTSLQSELDQQKELFSKLHGECDSLRDECTQLGRSLQENEAALSEKTHECQTHLDELSKKNESVASLGSQLEKVSELKVRLETENANMKKSLEDLLTNSSKASDEMTQRQAEIVGLHSHIQALSGQNQQIRAMYEQKEKELEGIKQVLSEMDQKVASTLEKNENLASQISALTEQNGHLQKEKTDMVKSLAEVAEEKTSLCEKVSGLEMQHSENRKIIDALLKDKEGLSSRLEELSKVSEQNRQSFDGSLLEKTSECASLSQQLSESEETVKLLKEQAETSVSQFNDRLIEKEQLILDQSKQIEGYQSQLAQLQETLSLLQEQGSALKSGLMEKDAFIQQQSKECTSLQGELDHQRELYANLQTENETLKGECSRLHQVLKEKESALEGKILECQNHTDELSKRNESVLSLSGQLGTMTENIVRLESDLKSSLESHLAESATLREELTLKQAEIVNLQDNIQALNEANNTMKAEVSKRLEEVAALQSDLANRDLSVASLTQQLSTLSSNTEALQLELQQREESFRQQEAFLSQLQAKSVEGEDQISQKMEAIAELQKEAQNLQKALQEKDLLLLKKDQEITLLSEKIAAESEASKARMNSDMDVISKLQGELQILLEKNDCLTGSVAEKDVLLRQEMDKYLSLKTSAANLEDTVSQLNSEVQRLSSEAAQLRTALSEKEQVILDIGNSSSLEVTSLNETLKAKDLENENLRQQLIDLQESVSVLNTSLSAQSAEVTSLKAALEESRCTVVDQNKALQDLQRKTDEAALFKDQFVESTELVSQLQGQVQELREESSRLSTAIEQKQSALINLQDKFASQAEELQETKTLLSQKSEEILNLNQAISEREEKIHADENSISALKQELLMLQNEIQELRVLNANISKQKDDALASHQINADSLMIEIERLKAQHHQVAAQVNSLTENLEQRELALHAINNQYAAQVKHTEQVVSEMQKLNELNSRLQEEYHLTKQELGKVNSERALKEEEVGKLVLEKEELSRNHNYQIHRLQEQLQSSSMSEVVEKMKAETEQLQVQVSAKDEIINGLKSEVQRIEQTLQESEKEWLSVLDRETQAKNILAEQLQGIENELMTKDSKVHALKQDLDNLNEKLKEATLAIKQGSEKLKEKELDALASRSKFEEILSTVQAKENENVALRQALHDMEIEYRQLEESKESSQKDVSLLSQSLSDKVVAFEEERVSLQTAIRQLREDSQSEVFSLRKELAKLSRELEQKQVECLENERDSKDKSAKITLLAESVNSLQEKLMTESENLKEASVKHDALLAEIQKRDEQIGCMTIQISQQKDLLTGLSQQLKERDASVTQVVASASNERIKHEELRNALLLQLEETKAHLCLCQSQMENMETEKKGLTKENEDLKSDISKLAKEKEAMKKKLQAALVVRKELLKKIEEHENQTAQNAKNGVEISAMQVKLEELMAQRITVTKEHDAAVSDLSHQLEQKDSKISALSLLISDKEQTIVQLEGDARCLQTKLNEQDALLTATLQKLDEQKHLVDQLQITMNEKDVAYQQEKQELLVKLDQLKKDVTMSDENTIEELGSELAKIKHEKEALQKKAHAALLARKETIKKSQESERKYTEELRGIQDMYKTLQEQHSQQTDELCAIQTSYDLKVQELEDALQSSECLQGEMEALKRNAEERERIIQDLRESLTQQETQSAQTSSSLLEELECLKVELEKITSEKSQKDQLLADAQEVAEKMVRMGSEHDKEIQEKNEEIARQMAYIQMTEQRLEQLQQDMTKLQSQHQNQVDTLNASLEELTSSLKASESDKSKITNMHDKIEQLVEERNLLKMELASALQDVAQKSEELLALQNTVTVTQQQLSQEHLQCQESRCEVEALKAQMETLQREKENCILGFEKSKHDVALLESQLKQLEEQNKELQFKFESKDTMVSSDEPVIQPQKSEVTYNQQVSDFKASESCLLEFQALLTEKEELISALEQQLQRQIHLHEVEMEKMRIEVSELQQKPAESTENKSVEQLTKKLQAALISRKELMKENRAIKEEMQRVSAWNEKIQTETLALERVVSELKQQKKDLESSVSALSAERQNLSADVDRILSDNHNLSAACESLKLTIENITQQKQAFSCQLESLKDSQTEELSEWKSKHADLKQEYESLLQAYENVSSEMDKMRQLLEGAKRERQEALLKTHKYESELDSLGKQVAELEDENDKIKEKMRKFAKLKQQKIEELEEENEKIRQDLISFDDEQKCTVDELTLKNNQLESEIKGLQELSEGLREKMCELQQDNQNLAQELKETSLSLEKWHMESKATESNLQLKLNEAFNLNNTFTAQIEAQKADISAQNEMIDSVQKEKLNLFEKLKQAEKDHEVELFDRDKTIADLQNVIEGNRQETISLNEKVRILEDDKCLLQEELENVQETSDKVKNENEYLETMLLKNSERIDELTEAVNILQTQNMQLSAQLTEVKEEKAKVCREKEEQHLKLVKEFEDKLKTLQRGTEGSKNMKKELQELLKEKHQEINQLQHDCIKYQELILNLERSLKHSQTEHQQVEKELREMSEKVANLQKENGSLETELKTLKNILNDTTKALAKVTSEKDRLLQEVTKRQQESEFESMEKKKSLEKLTEQQQALLKEQRVELQKQISDLQERNEREVKVIESLQKQVESKDLQVRTLQREAETNLAKLAILSVDSDRNDAAKQWDNVFQKALQDKDSQLLEQGFVITRLLEDNRAKGRALNDLQIANKKLERTLNEYSVAASAHQRQLFVLGASNTELNQTVEILTKRLSEQSALVERLESDKSTLVKQLDEQTYSVSQLQSNLEHSEKVLTNTQTQFLLVQSQYSKLQVDLERQEAISLHLKSLLQNKDREISSLLSSKDGQVSGYIEQLQANHRAQVAGYENRLTDLYVKRESAEKELRSFESKVRNLHARLDRSAQEKDQMMANINSLRNSIASLQTEKERLVSEVSQSRERVREGSAEGSLGATKGLKEEIKTLLHQMDDLNSENAMLKAQLIRYREDLNQVLSLKDNQLKDLLKKQQDSIKNLENQKRSVETQHRDALLEVQKEAEEIKALKDQNSKLQSQVQELEDSLLALHKDRLETDESKVIADLQQAVAVKAAECNELQQKLFAQKIATDDLNRSLKEAMNESERKLAEAEEKYNKELDAFERDVDLMRNEREIAEQRVADLARDLMQTEQQLSEATSLNKNLKSQNESLGKAMAALQNDRDQLIDDFKILRSRYDEELRETTASMNRFERQLNDATSELSALASEKHVLVQKLLAFESTNPQPQLSGLVNDLSQAVSEKEAELKQLSLQNNSYSRQVTAFSKAMASLQTDRDRLVEELRRAKREFEGRQQSSPDMITSIKAEESNSLSVSVDALQTERDGLRKEVVNLRSQNTELMELKQKYDDQQRELQQAKAHKLQCERDISGYQAELAELRSERTKLQYECQALREASKVSAALTGKDVSAEQLLQLQTERAQLQSHLQRYLVEIQQRDLGFQQLNMKLQQAVEEKAAVSAQFRAVSQTLRDTQLSLSELQNRCYWLENQHHSQHPQAQQGSVHVEVAPGAPQERSSSVADLDGLDIRELRSRLAEAELQLDSAQQNVSQLSGRLEEERARREAAEEALGLAEQRVTSMEPSPSRSSQRDFSIQLETDAEWEALILDPNQHLLMRKMKSGVHSCRRWLRGRSLYCSKMLTSRAKSRYLFMAYLLTLHILVFMCFAGAL